MSRYRAIGKTSALMSAERDRGKRFARSLNPRERGDFIDALVLGDYDWRDWFHERPHGAFLNAAFAEAQFLEEVTS